MNNEPSDTFTIVHADRSGGLGSALRHASRVEPRVPQSLAQLLDDMPAPRRAPRGPNARGPKARGTKARGY